MKYIVEAKHNTRIFAEKGITKELLVKQQIHQLIEDIPVEKLMKIFETSENLEYLGEEFLKIKVSVNI